MKENKIREPKFVPKVNGTLRSSMIEVPEEIYQASGIVILGKRIKSIVFSTDVSIIRNINADAILAVYPFTPQPVITQAIMSCADMPVFCGIGGGITQGTRVVNMAHHAENQGALGVVMNMPSTNEDLQHVAAAIDIPIIITVVSEKEDIASRLEAGAQIINVSAGARTAQVVKTIREQYPELPIMATGGNTPESILNTIEAGANAITWTPPSTGEIFHNIMDNYRKKF